MRTNNITDYSGLVAAIVCIAHCVALPIALMAGVIFHGMERFHEIMLFGTLLITGHALWHGYKQHCKHIVLFLGGAGVATLLLGVVAHALLHENEEFLFGLWIESAITMLGSGFIIGAHIFNLKFKTHCCKK